ncbi:MAG TPA: DinB family protein [Reyranella sp.]|nr:DinB family protein [Reyranella sp.]
MMDPGYFRLFADYNRWANRLIYDAAAKLSADEYFKPRPAFFKSIHGALNHLVVGDRIWLGRIVGQPVPYALDQILYGDLASLRAAREAEDERLIGIVGGIDAARLAGKLVYRNTRGEPFETPLAVVLGHMFNHETHHRGQVHDLLSQTEVPPPSLDLINYVRLVDSGRG